MKMHSRSNSSSSCSSISSSSRSSSSNSLSEINEVDVVVIGGGCSGLECAEKLYSYGFKNVLVLEAQDYLGGRAKTIYLNNDESLPLEMGANWIHGLWVKRIVLKLNKKTICKYMLTIKIKTITL